MNVKDVVIRLDTRDVLRVLEIEIDSDSRLALQFVRDILSKKVKDALEKH